MPISTAATHDRGSDQRSASHLGSPGFTLIELSLVVVIIGVVLTLVVPRLRDPGHQQLMEQSHHLVLTFRLLRSEAVLNGYAYRLNYDLDQQRYWATADGSGDLGDIVHDTPALARGMKLQTPVGFVDVVLPTLVGKVNQGQIYTVFYPDGSIDPTIIHLANGRDAYTLWLNPMNGRLNMDAGYRDVEYSG
jgi:prepilin-type N-terminal cleavage/methylation domain-containing protein